MGRAAIDEYRRLSEGKYVEMGFPALAGAEAGSNPNTSVRHIKPEAANRDEVPGVAMRREGLLQLAYADHKRYGCDFNWQLDRALKANDPAKTILQPKNNLECGRFWSTRPSSSTHPC